MGIEAGRRPSQTSFDSGSVPFSSPSKPFDRLYSPFDALYSSFDGPSEMFDGVFPRFHPLTVLLLENGRPILDTEEIQAVAPGEEPGEEPEVAEDSGDVWEEDELEPEFAEKFRTAKHFGSWLGL